MNAPDVDWAALARLRTAFLEGTAGVRDYWLGDHDLASYDATFAQRIGWKWDFVLADLQRRGWQPPAVELTDFGCGSGIAARAFLDQFGPRSVPRVRFVDRSVLAMRYAARRASERFPEATVTAGPTDAPGGLVLLSHVLTELDATQRDTLVERLGTADAVLWVEPGTFEASLSLIAIRERLRGAFHVVAPCCHNEPCGILRPGNEPHWCHHFAEPPGAVFTDPFWGRFAHLLGIDLRSLPVSYLVLDRRPPPPLPAGAVRILGRPRLQKAGVQALACDAAGVADHTLPRRTLPEAYRAARKDRFASLQVWTRDGTQITGCSNWPAPAEPTDGEAD